MLFPDGILVSKEKRIVRTERINAVIFEIARQSGTLAHKKTGVNDFDVVYPRLVGDTGFECDPLLVPLKEECTNATGSAGFSYYFIAKEYNLLQVDT